MNGEQAVQQLPKWCADIGAADFNPAEGIGAFSLPESKARAAIAPHGDIGWAIETSVALPPAAPGEINLESTIMDVVRNRAGPVYGVIQPDGSLALRGLLFFDGISENAFAQVALELDKASVLATRAAQQVQEQNATLKEIDAQHQAFTQEANRAVQEAENAAAEYDRLEREASRVETAALEQQSAAAESNEANQEAVETIQSPGGLETAPGTRYCTACGTENPSTNKFCSMCGGGMG